MVSAQFRDVLTRYEARIVAFGSLHRSLLIGGASTNITVQDQCPLDLTDHLEIGYDPVAMADMLNALDPAHPVLPPCLVVLPVTGPVGSVPSF